jgi:3-dehydroquinate synthase
LSRFRTGKPLRTFPGSALKKPQKKAPMTPIDQARIVAVDLPGRAYDIVIGRDLLAGAATLLAERFPGRRFAIVTDANVAAAAQLERLAPALEAQGLLATTIVLDPGEATKSWAGLQKAVEAILAARLERRDLVIAFGGGVIGDLTGFAAGIARRGIALHPGSDLAAGAGRFLRRRQDRHQLAARQEPHRRLPPAGPGARRYGRTRHAVPQREFRAGYAEVAKYGLIDKPESFFAWLEKNWPCRLCRRRGAHRGDGHELPGQSRRRCSRRAENGQRALLNLGHTFGHALEKPRPQYDSARLVHGEGVSIGMVLATVFRPHEPLPAPTTASASKAHLARRWPADRHGPDRGRPAAGGR